MTAFLQAAAAGLLAGVLGLMRNKQGKDMGTVLSIAVCCMVAMIAISYLQPVVEFLQKLETLGGLDESMVGILLKAVGIGFVAEIAGLICSDAGNSSLGKSIQILGSAVILWLSIPLFNSLIELVQEILGEI